ncbi:MAG: hypothetical protein ACXWQO_09580 [Bdellovibrionota bacterium]
MNHLNIEQNREKTSLSDELTVVFLRGNGSPRTFRVPLIAVQRSLTAIAFTFCLALLAAFFFFGLNLLRSSDSSPAPTYAPAVAIAPAPVPLPGSTPPADAVKTGIWQKIAGSVNSPSNSGGTDSELKKEVEGLHQDIARLNSQIDARKDLPKGTNMTTVLQLLGPRSVVMPESDTNIRVRNAKFTRDPAAKEIVLNFELHNIDEQQKQERGYIVAIAKTNDMMLVYPPNVFNPSQNIVLDFTKGETFGISRFRAATATFSAAALSGKNPSFQILLFSTDGRIIANQHVEEKQ